MITKIGLCAGEILSLLDEKQEPVRIEEIHNCVEVPKDVVLMSLGWLIREHLVCAVRRGMGIEISQNENTRKQSLQEKLLA